VFKKYDIVSTVSKNLRHLEGKLSGFDKIIVFKYDIREDKYVKFGEVGR